MPEYRKQWEILYISNTATEAKFDCVARLTEGDVKTHFKNVDIKGTFDKWIGEHCKIVITLTKAAHDQELKMRTDRKGKWVIRTYARLVNELDRKKLEGLGPEWVGKYAKFHWKYKLFTFNKKRNLNRDARRGIIFGKPKKPPQSWRE